MGAVFFACVRPSTIAEVASTLGTFPLARFSALSQIAVMQSHELLREVLQDTSAKQVAADLGLSLSDDLQMGRAG